MRKWRISKYTHRCKRKFYENLYNSLWFFMCMKHYETLETGHQAAQLRKAEGWSYPGSFFQNRLTSRPVPLSTPNSLNAPLLGTSSHLSNSFLWKFSDSTPPLEHSCMATAQGWHAVQSRRLHLHWVTCEIHMYAFRPGDPSKKVWLPAVSSHGSGAAGIGPRVW